MSVRDESIERLEKLAGVALEGAIKLGQDDAIRLAHRVLERFPGMRKKHMFIAGGAALSSAVLIGAAVAIAKRVRQGQTASDAAEQITEDELENLSLLERRRRPLRDVNEPDEAEVAALQDEDGHETPDTPAASHG
ncbi:MAG: hypothetical protein O2822_07615 [Chloroflexi bacterium]|nr:hypothetical protein [Chloroflexota bacterium]